MTEVTSPQQEPETPAETPDEAPATPEPKPEPQPEPDEQPDKGDEGDAKAKPEPKAKPKQKAKAKPKKLPESATRAGRGKAAKPQDDAKTKAQPKPKPLTKEQKQELVAEFKRMNERATKSKEGHDGQMRRKMRNLAEKLGRNAPKWAQIDATKKRERKPREITPDIRLALEATAFATGGKVEGDQVKRGDIKFGASVTDKQVHIMRGKIKGKNVLQMLGGVPEKRLADYARGSITRADLPDDAKTELKKLNDSLDKQYPTLKFWARKDAVILLFLHRERKSSQRKQAKKDAAREPVAA
jgi:hypothetical protein